MVKQNTHELNKIKIHIQKKGDSFTSSRKQTFSTYLESRYFCVWKNAKNVEWKTNTRLYASKEAEKKDRRKNWCSECDDVSRGIFLSHSD